VDDLWERLLRGESGIREIRAFETSEFKVKFAGEIQDWSTEGYLPVKDTNRLDRFAQFAVVAAADAVADAGIDLSAEDPFRCGVILGSGVGGLHEIETQHTRLLEKGPDKVSAFTIPKLMINAASGQVSIRFGLRGPNTAIATACASATNAIGDAFKAIQYDDADVMLTGGSEAPITPMGLSGFASMRALSTRGDNPQEASRPFDADRDGFVMSEGAGLVVLEELEHAKARGAKIYCEVVGYGATGDAGHITQPDAHGVGAAKSIQCALDDGRIDPTSIDYINAHGTSTVLGDGAETQAIKTVFKDHAYKLSISSTKSQLGHLLGASGGLELVAMAMSIEKQTVPPTINYDTSDPVCDLDYTPNKPRQRQIRMALSNSFGFGGHNACVIVGALTNGQH